LARSFYYVRARARYLSSLSSSVFLHSQPQEAAAGGVLQVLCYFPYLTGLGILSFEDVVVKL